MLTNLKHLIAGPMLPEVILAFIIPVIITLLVTPRVIKFATYIGAVDTPGGRKIHNDVTPRLGGLAIAISMISSGLIFYLIYPELFESFDLLSRQSALIGSSIGLIFVLGFYDDLHPLKPGLKFGVQFLSAALIYLAGLKISNITNPLGDGLLNIEMIDFPFTLLWIVGITNAFNLIDGLDGLASGISTIALVSIFTVSAIAGDLIIAIISIMLAGALVGFLRFNFSPAKIFLGDSGSLLIGFSLALMSIQSTTKISTGLALMFPILVLGLPITDTMVSMLRRYLKNYMPEHKSEQATTTFHKIRGMFIPDKSHIHHQLLSLGFTHRNTVLVLYVVSAFFALGAFVISQSDRTDHALLISLIMVVALTLGLKKLQYREISILNNGIMLPIYERWILNHRMLLSLVDLGAIIISYSLSYYLVYQINAEHMPYSQYVEIVPIVLTLQFAALWLTGLYRETIRQMGIGNVLQIVTSVGYALGATAIVMLPYGLLYSFEGILLLIVNFYFLLSLVTSLRVSYVTLSYLFSKNKNFGNNVLLYGANENGAMVLHKINNTVNSTFKVLGFLDDDPEMEGKHLNGYPIIGGYWKLSKILRKSPIDFIFICDKNIKPENFKRLTNFAVKNGIKVKRLEVRLKNISVNSGTYNPKTQNGINIYYF